MSKIKRVFSSEDIYSYEERYIHSDIEKFCEEKSNELLNFKLESHSVLMSPGQTSHCLYEGTYTSPDSFTTYIVYSYDIEDDETFLCIDKTSINSEKPLILKIKATSKEKAINEFIYHASYKKSKPISKEDVLCENIDDILVYE